MIDNLHAEAFQAGHFAGMVRQQPNLFQAQIGEDLRTDSGLVLRLVVRIGGGEALEIIAMREDAIAISAKP